MIDITLISLFIPTFFLVSITPGLCMTLAMTLGMSIGVRKTLWMMVGEVIGVALVALAAVFGVAAIMTRYPQLFVLLKILGALYLFYIGINMWRSRGKMALNSEEKPSGNIKPAQLFSQGFITAVANPKGWAFMVSLLPPFINKSYALQPQLIVLVAVIMVSEFVCMMIYASGGKTLAALLSKRDNVKMMNKVSGSLMIAVAIWLALS